MDSERSTRRPTKPFRPVAYFFRSFWHLVVGTGFFGLFVLFFVYYWLDISLPPLKGFDAHVRTPNVAIQAMDGTLLASYGDAFEEFLSSEDLPPYVSKAFLAVEDRRFFEHKGLDFIGIVRAAWRNLNAHRVVQGGSTLTQQLAKNMLMASGYFPVWDRSVMRKLQEMVLTLKLEAYFSKIEILTLYLNRVYFGAGTYGIDAASRRYFHKSARELTLFEAAVLAGLLRAPSRYSPLSNPKRACERAQFVLRAMESAGFVSAQWQQEWSEWEKKFCESVQHLDQGSRYFADWVFETIASLIGPIDQDLTVVTTLHPEIQHKMEEILRSYHQKFGEEYQFSQAASVVMTPGGAVLGMVGGLDYGKSQFNRATSALRQPGSSFKTFIYLAALEAGLGLDDLFDDSAYEQGEWKPGNYKWKELGEISMLEAMTYSVNSVCIRVAKQIGLRNVIRTARRLGISSPLKANLTLALGASEVGFLEMMRAYAPFFNDGYACWPYGIYEIRNKAGDILYQKSDEKYVRVIEDDVLQNIRIMLRTVIRRGTGRAANVDEHIAGKTGSNSSSDAWFFGGRDPQANALDTFDVDECSPHAMIQRDGVVVGVWIGHDSPEKKMAAFSTGGRIPTRMAADIFRFLLTKPQMSAPSQPTERPLLIVEEAQSSEDSAQTTEASKSSEGAIQTIDQLLQKEKPVVQETPDDSRIVELIQAYEKRQQSEVDSVLKSLHLETTEVAQQAENVHQDEKSVDEPDSSAPQSTEAGPSFLELAPFDRPAQPAAEGMETDEVEH